MALHGNLIVCGKSYGIEVPSYHLSEPKKTVHVWVLDTWHIVGMVGKTEADAIGKPATLQDGRVSVYLGEGTYLRGELAELGSTKAISVTTTEVPRPKVRKGMELRWHNYMWQKYIKSKGWIEAR